MNANLDRIVKTLKERGQRLPLMPTAIWNRELEEEIRSLEWLERSREPAIIALMAGLHLMNDSLDVSHRHAQRIEHDATGAYWHGLMHRMEGDFSNAKYWYSQAGRHPSMAEAANRIARILADYPELDTVEPAPVRAKLMDYRDQASWHPSDFTDLVRWQHERDISPALRDVLERIQSVELNTLLEYTMDASGVASR
jgi:hypothetical protein